MTCRGVEEEGVVDQTGKVVAGVVALWNKNVMSRNHGCCGRRDSHVFDHRGESLLAIAKSAAGTAKASKS